MDLSIFKNIHKGKRGFLLASGPSLSYTNLHLILNEIKNGIIKKIS